MKCEYCGKDNANLGAEEGMFCDEQCLTNYVGKPLTIKYNGEVISYFPDKMSKNAI